MKFVDIDKRFGLVYKYKDFLGDYWFNKCVSD